MSRGLFSSQNQVGESYSFTTNKNGTFYWFIDKHDPTQYPAPKSGPTLTPERNIRIDYGDGSLPESPLPTLNPATTISNAQSHTYSDGSDKVITFSTDKLEEIRSFFIGFTNTVNNVFTGKTNLDLTPFTKIFSIQFPRNTNITGVTFNTDGTQPVQKFYGNQCDLRGTLDVSSLNMTDFESFVVNTNTNLTKIIFPSNVNMTGNNTANNCNLSGHYDFSSWSGVGSQFNWSSNNLTGLTLPTIVGTNGSCVNGFLIPSNDLTGTLDLSPLGECGRSFSMFSNPNLTKIIFPSNTRDCISMRINGCDLTGDLDMSGVSGLTTGSYLTFHSYDNVNLSGITTSDGLNTIKNALFRDFDINQTNIPWFDLSGSTFETGYGLGFTDCVELTTLILPVHPLSYTLDEIVGESCPKLTDLNISAFDIDGVPTNTFPSIQVSNATTLSGLTTPITGKTGEVHFLVDSCNLSTLDLSNYLGLMKFDVSNNANLTNLTLPLTTSTRTLTDASLGGNPSRKTFEANNCDLGYVDFKPMSGVTLNGSSTIHLQDNNMVAGEVNHILVDFETTTWDTVTLDISGTNSAPDSSSGGFDGVAALSTLTGGTRNWIITTS